MKIRPIQALLAVAFVCLFVTGCKKSTPIISNVTYQIEPNIETVELMLNFDKSIKTDLGGSYAVKDYGNLVINPWDADRPFQVGFRLNLNVLYDNDYATIAPVRELPGGQPLPVAADRPMVLVKLKTEHDEDPTKPRPLFDIYTYVDVLQKEWVGMAIVMKFINEKYFPAGLTVSKNFLKDKDQRARAVGTFFGPKLDSEGNLMEYGGIAVFANVKALLADKKLKGRDKNNSAYLFEGPMASYYRKDKNAQRALNEAMRTLLNTKGLM